ncbi:hypothetical protein SAMN02745163_00512 [Clostridium cavendishii DSM 21758]|uniref:Uncharacterized protein n=1 Tax=Clostridium cavendishii DSM 21758 TaxID=1121302 RepID=A0A1M6CNQ8_9CLOT|nr:hypothetical protein [Clostridium cavendishii]SHI62610.1 hypothetical protein SAMN02745163_00512 [Clostridium cavendishii DSM 21758]
MERRKRGTLTRIKRRKLRKKKIRKITLILVLLILASSIFFLKQKVLTTKCKDLYYATEHYMTTGMFNSNKLLRVKTMKLVFADKDSAVVEAYGLSSAPPNAKITYKAYFKKDSNNSWALEKAIPLDNKNLSYKESEESN